MHKYVKVHGQRGQEPTCWSWFFYPRGFWALCLLSGLVVSARGAIAQVSSGSYWDQVTSIMWSRHKVSYNRHNQMLPTFRKRLWWGDKPVSLLCLVFCWEVPLPTQQEQPGAPTARSAGAARCSHCPHNSLVLLHFRVNASSVTQASPFSASFRFSLRMRPRNNKMVMWCTDILWDTNISGRKTCRRSSICGSLMGGSCSLRPSWMPGTEDRTLL